MTFWAQKWRRHDGINMYIQSRRCINMFIVPCIYIPDHKHVYKLYIHGIYMFQLTYTYSEIYVHVHMRYRHVFTMFSYFHACSGTAHCLFKWHTWHIQAQTFYQMYIQLWTKDIHIDDMFMFAFCFSQLAGYPFWSLILIRRGAVKH